ncbi:cuticle protein 16.8-like isoform X1 [Stegodyphus dumicola]|uniref:cuticle protein 16.8-like isoform X1 n=1 Tax=Stegodyphus dumicola TaxID=202533 RepID=UPI0015AD6C5E|nr:cuticle protein 16.8-like isoform X1 [Stegodyphus dumicola]
MFVKVALFCLVSLAAAQYGPKYDVPVYAKPYGAAYEEKPQPYSFGYDVKDDYGTTLTRKEEGDDYGNKRGSYGYVDAYGIYRQVDYVADDKGFRAAIKTNEPGTENQNPADVEIQSEAAPVKYDSAPAYGKAVSAPAYARAPVAAPAYSRPAPAYKPAPAIYASGPVYQPAAPAAVYQPAAPAPVYQPAAPQYSAPVYSAPAPSKLEAVRSGSYAPY